MKENYLQRTHQLRMYSKGFQYFNKARLPVEHVGNKIKIFGELVDINEIIMTEFHNNKFPITPYLLASFEYSYSHLRKYYSEYGTKTERLFFRETLGESHLCNGDYFDVGDFDLELIKNLDKLESRYKILTTIIIPNGGKTRLEGLTSICSKYYLIDNQANLVTVMLNAFYTIFRALAYNKQEIFNTYFLLDEFENYRSKLDVSFDDTINICQSLVIDWAINIFKRYLKSANLAEIKGVMDSYDIEIPLRFSFKRGSKFKKYLEGKIMLAELIDSRNKTYKSRKSDYACEALSLWTEESKIKDFGNYFSDEMIESLVEREVQTNGRKGILRLISSKAWLTEQFELAHKYGGLLDEVDELKNKIRELEKKANSFDKAIKKRENRISILDEKLKQSDTKYKDSVLKEVYDSVKNELESTKQSLKEGNTRITKLETELTDKTKQCSDITKLNKKYKAKLEMYTNLFGEISDEEDVDLSIEEISIEEKVKALEDLDIVVCGGSIEMDNYFEKLGLKVYQILELSDSAFKKNFDILVVVTDMTSHQMVYRAKKQANAIGAMCLYVQGTNKEKIIDSIYSKLMSESS